MQALDSRYLSTLLGVSDRAVRDRAARQSWTYTTETCRGGQRRLYALASLPADVQQAVLAREGGSGASSKDGLPAAGGCSLDSRLRGNDEEWRANEFAPTGGDITPSSSTLTPNPSPRGRGESSPVTLIGELVGSRPPNHGDHERAQRAVELMRALKPLLALPARHRGRRAMAESIGEQLGLCFQQVYRLENKAREGGVAALTRLGVRSDRGAARHVVSRGFEDWCAGLAGVWGKSQGSPCPSPQELGDALAQAVAQATVAGAPSARQAWLKATAKLGRDLMGKGAQEAAIARLLQLECPRRWVEATMQSYRVAGKSLRDAKGCYDQNITPVKRTAAGLVPGELVCGDVSPLDIPVLRADGSTAYARMISWHDVATNWLWIDLFLVDKGEGVRREHVAASFARMCAKAPFGAPRGLYLDNGSEYKWEEMLHAWGQLAELTKQQTRVDMADLSPAGGKVTRSIPFHPRGKRIEGQFGHLERWLGWWLGHVGGNRMTKKSANLGQAPVSSDFLAVQDWLKRTLDDYHVTPQPGAEHMQKLSPQGRIEQFLSAGWKPYHIDREVLLLAFAVREERKVVRGAINYKGRTWTADFLMGLEGKVEIAYPKVALLPDEEILFVFMRGKLLGAACPERTFGILDGDGAKEAGRRRQAFKLVMADRIKEAGGALDEASLAGFRAGVFGLDATLNRAAEAAVQVDGSGELAAMVRARAAHVSERTQAILQRAEAAKQAESLSRLMFEDEETAAARALGF